MTELATQPTEIWFTRCGGATASTIAVQENFLHDEFGDGDEVLLRSATFVSLFAVAAAALACAAVVLAR